MRKQELIHLHGLLLEVQKNCTQEADLSEYESLGIGASSIYRHKDEHRAAVFALIEAISGDLQHEQTTVASLPPA
jgi:hypothetical protein